MSAYTQITGYLSKDAVTRDVNGKAKTVLSIPNKTGFGEREKTDWYTVEVWGKLGEITATLKKGDYVSAGGMQNLNVTERGYFLTVRADHVSFCRNSEAPKKQTQQQEDDVPW